jgi:hypothetical protein
LAESASPSLTSTLVTSTTPTSLHSMTTVYLSSAVPALYSATPDSTMSNGPPAPPAASHVFEDCTSSLKVRKLRTSTKLAVTATHFVAPIPSATQAAAPLHQRHALGGRALVS